MTKVGSQVKKVGSRIRDFGTMLSGPLSPDTEQAIAERAKADVQSIVDAAGRSYDDTVRESIMQSLNITLSPPEIDLD